MCFPNRENENPTGEPTLVAMTGRYRTMFKSRIHRAAVTQAGERGSGVIGINGAAAYLGDALGYPGVLPA